MRFFLTLGILFFANLASADWTISDNSPAQDPKSPLIYERKQVSKNGQSGFFSAKRIDLIWFHSSTHTFRVIDNGPANAPKYSDIVTAMKRNDCIAGTNGGFFLKNHAPSGLMIANGTSTGRFGQGSLLSGVVLSSGNRNPYLLRRSEYGEKFKPTDLLQTGPFLVDQGTTVRGLSGENSRRRSFILHDGDDWFGLGLSDSFTLAELGEILAHKDFSPSRSIHRALNLDGGTSSGFYVERGGRAEPVHVEPFKTVRNFLGITTRDPE